MSSIPFSITPTGDAALSISFGKVIDNEIHHHVVSLYHALKQSNFPEVRDIIPAYASLTIVYDVMAVKKVTRELAFDYMKSKAEQILKQEHSLAEGNSKTLHIPVCYDESLGVDLANISKVTKIAINEIIRLHSSITYRVYMLGFLPGFAYMGKVDDKIAFPRKECPANVIAGSVGIADNQTGIYPVDSPGGWNIVGQTPEPLFYPRLNDPCLFHPGDLVKFEPITLAEFITLKEA